jgi:RNA polymerase sigma-70 factor (ECF subfamily)
MEHEDQTIQAWVQAAQAGDEASIGKLFEFFQNRIFRFLAYRVNSQADAEDLTQTVFLEMIRGLPRYKPRRNAKFSTWLFQIARHRLIDYYRSNKPVMEIGALVESKNPGLQVPAQEFELDTRTKALKQKLKLLTEKQQTVICLMFVENYDISEIASLMRISALQVRVLKHRAVKKLSQLLKE